MHQISEISVVNFKAIRSANFKFSSYTPLVGYNNAGKSSILQALSWVISPSSIPKTGFNDFDQQLSVSATVIGISERVLDGLADNHRTKIEPLIQDEILSFRRTQLVPGAPVSQIRLEIFDAITANDWIPSPTGISAALSALFPEVIEVGAMENAAVNVGKNTSTSTIGKLIKQIVDPVRLQYSAQIEASLAPIAQQLSARGNNKNQTLLEVDAVIEGYLGSFFPGMSAKTHIPMPDIDDILKKATIRVSETRYGDDLEGDAASMGHGAQRSVQIALINALAQIRRSGLGVMDRTILLLLDEPELYLHPQAIAVVKTALKQLSQNGFQVAFTTHTGELIGSDDASKTLIIRRNADDGCRCLPTMEEVAAIIGDAGQQADTLFELSNSKEFLFSDRVVLVEGRTETVIFPHIYHAVNRRSLAESRVGLIKLDGSGGLKKAADVLRAMGLEVKIIADLDYVFKTARQNGMLGVTDERFSEIRSICSRLADQGCFVLADDGFPKKSEISSAEQGFARLAQEADARAIIDTFVQDLQEMHVWIWPRGSIEEHIGIEGKSLTAQRQFVQNLKQSNDLSFLPDVASISEAVAFIDR